MAIDTSSIVSCAIYPAIGIARVGNSPVAHFIGPEYPGQLIQPPGGFKDKAGRIKRQGARFRIYGFDGDGNVVAELTRSTAKITWTVHVANRKAAWFCFEDRFHFRPPPPFENPDYDPSYPPLKGNNTYTLLRNASVSDRESLVVDPGPRTIEGRDVSGPPYRFDGGTFRGTPVPLGEVQTDSAGRLVVLGGFGHAASIRPRNPLQTSFNNDDWYDDMSDGPVTATVTLEADGRTLTAAPARVVVAPPNFAPATDNIVSLYDRIAATSDPNGAGAPRDQGEISFTRDIYPILRTVTRYAWVSQAAHRGHGQGKGGDLLNDRVLPKLASAAPSDRPSREAVFKRIRDPRLDYDSEAAKEQASLFHMPPLGGDAGGPSTGDARTFLRVTTLQYALLRRWAEGDFTADWKDEPEVLELEELALHEQPQALNEAALAPCVGGGFHPGIEITYICEHADLYAGPFRFRGDIEPGGITKFMALPWHGDFFSCHVWWWPAQRPEVAVTESAFRQIMGQEVDGSNVGPMGSGLPGASADPSGSDNTDPKERAASALDYLEPWDRGLADYFQDAALSETMRQENAMVDLWSELGFVVPKALRSGEVVFIETERDPLVGVDIRELYYRFANMDAYPDAMPKARWYVDRCLREAWEAQDDPNFPADWRHFTYSTEAFEARLNQLYDDTVIEAAAYDPATDPTYRTREDVIMWLTQMAPFNQNDGAWIRRVTPSGPLSEIDALLFSIWMDEAGDGNAQWSHCNLYTTTLHSLGIYFSDVHSRAYVNDPRFLDSAFTVPALELAIAELSGSYFPEILGFTLVLEWSVLSIRPAASLLEYYGIDPHFYTLHIGIDNAAAGHGWRAKRAVELYLDQVRQRGGEEAVQEQWKRIWTGFIAFVNTGTLGQEVQDILKNKPTPADKFAEIIERKRPIASLNHRDKMVGTNRINDWFEDPPGFMAALVSAGYIVPGDPGNSPFFKLTSFNGPMFKVFTDEELDIVNRWVMWLAEDHEAPVVDYAVAMAHVIAALRGRQAGTFGHTVHTLTGAHPDAEAKGEHTVAWWFEHAHHPAGVIAFMQALSDPANAWIQPGKPDQSRFVTELLAPSRPMGAAFNTLAPGAGGLTSREVAIGWVASGCPIPRSAAERSAPRVGLFTAPPETGVYPRPRVRGMGSIH